MKRTERVPIGKASLDFTGTRIWPTPCSIMSLGFDLIGSFKQIVSVRDVALQITQLSCLSTTVILLLASDWIHS